MRPEVESAIFIGFLFICVSSIYRLLLSLKFVLSVLLGTLGKSTMVRAPNNT